MKLIILILSIAILCVGCTTYSARLERLKAENKNTVICEVDCLISDAKLIVQQAIKEYPELIERTNLEKENFIFANSGYGSAVKQSIAHSLILGQNCFTRLGFFFDYDNNKNITKISISEETVTSGGLLAPLYANCKIYRFEFNDKIKLKALSSLP